MTRREALLVEMLRSWDLMDPAGSSGIRSTDGSRVPLLSHEPHCLMHAERLDMYLARDEKNRVHCTCWLRGMRELERCLRVLRATERRLWFHVHERYVAAHRRPMEIRVHKGKPKTPSNVQLVGLIDTHALNKRGDGTVRVLVDVWSDRVDTELAARGVAALSGLFRGEPGLPVEFTREAA